MHASQTPVSKNTTSCLFPIPQHIFVFRPFSHTHYRLYCRVELYNYTWLLNSVQYMWLLITVQLTCLKIILMATKTNKSGFKACRLYAVGTGLTLGGYQAGLTNNCWGSCSPEPTGSSMLRAKLQWWYICVSHTAGCGVPDTTPSTEIM